MSRMWVIFIVVLLIVIVVEAFFVGRYFYARKVGRIVSSGNATVKINQDGSKSTVLPGVNIPENLKSEIRSVTKDKNREYVIGASRDKRLMSVSGQLVSALLQSPEVLTVEVVHEDTPIHFLEVLSNVGLIDNRNGQFKTLKINDFLAIRPDPPLTVACSVLVQNGPNEFRCGLLLLQNFPQQ